MGKVRYSVVIEWDELDELYVAAIPALSVATYGDTRAEALVNVREAMQVTVEGLRATGQPVPEGDGETIAILELEV